jgi:RNA recognition motif.
MSQETSHSPAPPIAAPSPLQIGKAFIKQYYQVLSTNPLQIQKFYKPDSVISHALLPSVPATPQTFSEMSKSVAGAVSEGEESPGGGGGGGASLIFQWCKAVDENHKVCFDFGRGAIDAQETVNGGILLVVTGHMGLPQQDASNDDGMKRFVHTFFLNNSAPAGKKRQFYVHNDVLRFLDEGVVASSLVSEEEGDKASESHSTEHVVVQDQDSTKVEGNGVDEVVAKQQIKDKETAAAAMDTPQTTTDKAEDVVEEDVTGKESLKASTTAAEIADNVGGSEIKREVEKQTEIVEKDNVMMEEETIDESEKKKDSYKSTMSEDSSEKIFKSDDKKDKIAGTSQDKKTRKNKSRGRSRKSRSSSPTDGSKSTKGKKAGVSGSWASLVAGGSGPSAVAAAAANVASGLTKEDKDIRLGKDGKEQKIDSGKKSSAGVSEKQKKTEEVVVTEHQPPVSSKKAAAAQRTPEATILIKNVSDKVKESEIRAIFEPYASKLQKKILSITLLSNRGFCFVDFDSKDVVDEVMKIVEMEKDAKAESKQLGKDEVSSKFMADGREFDIGRKVPGEKVGSGGRGRGFRRSSSPNRGGGYNKSSRGVGRKNSPRGANRSAPKK